MNKENALNIILANACCTLANSCKLCPFYDVNGATKECEDMSIGKIREAVELLHKEGMQ